MPKIEDFEPGGLSEYGQNIEPGNKRNPLSAGISSGLDDLQGVGYSAIAAVSDAVGAKGVRDWANQRADLNEYEAAINGRSDLEGIENQTLGSALPYVGYQVAKQVPNLVGAIAAGAAVPQVAVPAYLSRGAAALPRALGGGGMGSRVAAAGTEAGAQFGARRAALEAGQTFGKQVVGGMAFNEGQAIGSLYQAARDGGDEEAGLRAIAGSPLYAAAETIPEAMLIGRFKSGSGFNGNLLSRAGKSSGVQAASGATSEGLQGEMEIAYNGNMSDEQKASARLNSITTGAIVEGVFGAFGGGTRGRTRTNTRTAPDSMLAGGNESQIVTAVNQGNEPQNNTQVVMANMAAEARQKQAEADEAEAQIQQAAVLAKQQADQEAAAKQQAINEGRAQTMSAFGMGDPKDQTKGNLFGQPLFGPNVGATTDAVAQAAATLTPVQQDLTKAVAVANTETGNRLVKFKFNATNVNQSVAKAFESVGKVLTEFQIGHVQSTQEAAEILNAQSNNLKGEKLEQVNAIHQALTGKDTSGYLASQQSGDKNGKVQSQKQANAGVRTVPAGSEPTNALLQSGQLQPLGTGSQPSGQNGQQNVVTGEGGAPLVQSSAAPIGNANVGNQQVTSQGEINGQANQALQAANTETAGGTIPAGTATAAGTAAETGSPATGAATNVDTGSAQGSVQANEARGDQPTGRNSQESTRDSTESFLDELIDAVVQRTGQMSAETLPKYRDFIKLYFGARAGQVDVANAAEFFGIDKNTAKRWSQHARTFATKWKDSIAKQAPALMAKYGITREQLLDAIEIRKATLETVEYDEEGKPTRSLSSDDTKLDTRDLNDGEDGKSAGGMHLTRKTADVEAIQREREDKKIKENTGEVKSIPVEQYLAEQAAKGETAPPKKVVVEEKAETQKDTEEEVMEADDIKAAKAWDAVAKDFPDAPKFADLSDDQRQNFIEFGENNWTRDDVVQELAVLQLKINNAKAEREKNIATAEQNAFLDGLTYDIEFKKEGTKAASVSLSELQAMFPGIARGLFALEKLGIQAAANINEFFVMKNSGSAASVVTTKTDGNVSIIVGFDEAYLRALTEGEMAFTVVHEMGHITDMAGFGGIYSAHPDMKFISLTGLIKPVGNVAKEIHDVITNGNNPIISEIFNYPYAPKYSNRMGSIEFREEVFAQLFAMMPNAKLNALLKEVAPQTHQFMTEVFEHAKTQISFRNQSTVGAETRRAVLKGAFEGRNQGSKTEGTSGLPRGSSEETVIRRSMGFGAVEKAKSLADKNISSMPKVLQSPIRGIWDALFNAKEAVLSLMITEDVASMAKKYMPAVAKYIEIQHERSRITTEREEVLAKIQVKFNELDQNTRRAVNKLIEESTVNDKWAYDPQIPNVKVTPDPDLNARFKAMPKEAQAVVRAVFDYGRVTLAEKQAAIRAQIDEAYKDDPTNPKKEELLRSFATVLNLKPVNPYAPLKRFGAFVVVGKSQAYLEAEKNGDSKELEKLRSQGSHYIVEFAETAGEARQLYQDLKSTKSYAELDAFKKSQAKDKLYSGADLWKGFAKLKRVIAAEKGVGGSEIAGKLEAMVNELYLISLADSSARKSELQRKGVAGYNRDMMRSFFTQGMADAHYIANLKTADKSLDAMVEMQKQASDNPEKANPYLNELMAREAQSLEIREPSLLDAANRMTAHWFLTFSPSFYFQQTTQAYVLSLPWMAGRFGYFKSERALRAAYKEVLPLVKDTNLKEHLDFTKLPADVQDMLKTLIGRSRINIGIEAELGNQRSEPASAVGQVFNKTTDTLRGSINRIEAINRAATAMAAYRLEMQKSGNKEKAIEAADKVVHETHGSYDGFNEPRFFGKNAVTRSVTQFRRFQIIQLSMLARMLHASVKGASPTERAMARKQFAFLMGHMFTLAGAKGMPMYGLATVAYTLSMMAFGDDDDPEDLEAWLRSNGGILLAKGIPAWMGVDVSDKLGMGKVTSLLPYTDVDLTSRKGLEKVALGVMGPFAGGLLPKMADGVGLTLQGDYYKGLEQLLPNGFSNGIKAVRFATEGVTMRNGDLVMSPEELGFFDVVTQAVGLPSTTITERTYRQNEVRKFDEFYATRAKEVKAQYVKAYRSNDTSNMADARDAWATLQESRVKYGYTRQPVSQLIKAPMEAAKREKSAVGGVETNKGNRRFVQELGE